MKSKKTVFFSLALLCLLAFAVQTVVANSYISCGNSESCIFGAVCVANAPDPDPGCNWVVAVVGWNCQSTLLGLDCGGSGYEDFVFCDCVGF